MGKSLKIQYHFIKWFLLFILAETLILINLINSELFIFKLLLNYLFVLALVPIVFEKVRRGRIDIFSPFVIFELSYILLFAFPALDLVIFKSEIIQSEEYFYNLSLFYIIIGLHFFHLGYFSKFGQSVFKKIKKKDNFWSKSRIKIIVIAFSFFSFISFLLIIEMSGGFFYYLTNIKNAMVKITTGSSFIFMSVVLIKIPLLIWFYYNLEKKHFPKSFYIFLILVFFLLLLLGERGPLMFLIVSMTVCYYYLRERINFLKIFVILTLLICFLVVYGQYRELSSAGLDTNKIDIKLSYVLDDFYNIFVGQFDQFERVKDIVKYVPDKIDYCYGKTFFNLILKPIPSRIWAEKPQGAGVVVTKALYPKHFAAQAT
ncbi:O-antigen polysaccharide polymerase Wzy, partial [Candidatus Peregrinibacteria bacterium]|nr:O-antigen polysaccharide polymerase Wzy [Candidatus Peregrinibacteria bacterium]